MTAQSAETTPAGRLLVRGIHLTLTPALRLAAETKCQRLLRHHPRIVRVRVDLEHDRTRAARRQFVAHGRIELPGPDLVATVATEDGYKSLDLLADKLDAQLRSRHGRRIGTRNDRHPGRRTSPRLPDED